MIDAGWPDTLPQLLQLFKQNGVMINDIKYLLVTHFHPDHAGLAQNLKDFGVKLIVHESQIDYIDKLNEFFHRKFKSNYKDISTRDNIIMSSEESRSLLKELNMDGEIVETPGHSDDSVSLIVDGYCAFTGDLPEFSLIEAYNDEILKESWKLIKDYNVKRIYPAHGQPYDL
jgi:glyoxylase-like metal-dependent hydrolase (beta-lactamase superfamily II)